MKKIIILLVLVMVSTMGFAQYDTAPKKMSYQAIIRNSNNELVKNSPVMIKLSILENSITGISIYTETHSQYTNENGLLNIQIGGGQAINEEYKDINWGKSLFLKTEIDPLGVGQYTITSTSELLSVPVSNFSHVSTILDGPAWKFVGAYKQVNQEITDFQHGGYSFINYLGFNKVSWTWKFKTFDNNLNGTFDLNEIGFERTMYGTVVGNIVTFVSQDVDGEIYPQIIGTLIGNNLTMSIPEGTFLVMMKE
jgi:hypothetical protein